MPREYFRPDAQQEQVIATFGQARLMKLADRTYELVGGSASDREAAGKWIGQFMKGDVVRGVERNSQ
jgi:hypothetical protein